MRKTTKAAEKTTAAKTTETKTTTAKTVETVKETAPVAETKVEEVKTEEVKEEVKAPVKKTAAKKTTTKTTAAKTTRAKKAAKTVETNVFVQYLGKEIAPKQLMETAKQEWIAAGHKEADLESLNIYIKTEENKAYYVVNGIDNGEIDL